MTFFQKLFTVSEPDAETSRVAVVLSYRDIAALCDVVEKVLELHRSVSAYRDRSSTEEAFH